MNRLRLIVSLLTRDLRFRVLTCLILITSFNVNAQYPAFEWAYSNEIIHFSSDLYCEAIKVDHNGNVITAGYHEGTIDFDPAPGFSNQQNFTSNGFDCGYIQKVDNNGDFIWAAQLESSGGRCNIQSIDIDAAGNIYCIGSFQGTTDFDPGPGVTNLTPTGNWDVFVIKLNENGTLGWVKQIEGAGGNLGFSIAVEENGNISLVGFFQDITDFDPGPSTYNLTPQCYSDVFITKLDSNGDFLWAKQFGSPDPQNSMEEELEHYVDNNGNIIITGWFNGTIDFDPGPASLNFTVTGATDMFVLKLDANGDLVWAKQVGSSSSAGQVLGKGISVDSMRNIYVIGSFDRTTDFDPGTGVHSVITSNNKAFVLKLDENGDFVWVKHADNNQDAIGFSAIETLPNGKIFITGAFNQTADFDFGVDVFELSAEGLSQGDAFILKLDENGGFIWAGNMGGREGDYGETIAVDTSENIYSTGWFSEYYHFNGSDPRVDMDPGIGVFNFLPAVNSINRGVYVQKLGLCYSTSSSISETVCGSYTSPSGNNTYTSSGVYEDTIANARGCDSIITINLTVNPLPTITTSGNISICDGESANLTASGASSYTWNNNAGTGSSVSVSPSNTTAYTVTGTDINSCVNTEEVTVTVNSLPQVTISGEGSICFGESTNLTASGATSYQWSNSLGSNSTVNVSPSTTTTYTVTGIDANLCESMDQHTVTVTPLPDATISQSGETLTAQNGNSGVTYQWLDCDNGLSPINGENSQVFNVTVDGAYAVQITQSGCINVSNCIDVQSAGLEESNLEEIIPIYPNPTNGTITIDLMKISGDVSVKLTDVTGKLLESYSYVSGKKVTLNFNYSAGPYLLRIETDNTIFTHPMIIE